MCNLLEMVMATLWAGNTMMETSQFLLHASSMQRLGCLHPFMSDGCSSCLVHSRILEIKTIHRFVPQYTLVWWKHKDVKFCGLLKGTDELRRPENTHDFY